MKRFFYMISIACFLLGANTLSANDNYMFHVKNSSNGHMMEMMRYYHNVSIDMSNDIFTSESKFNDVVNHTIPFNDNNMDGIGDIFQDYEFYHGIGFSEFTDINNDSIADIFQTKSFYGMVGMTNFVDVDNDGICDNYENFNAFHKSRFYDEMTLNMEHDIFINNNEFNELTNGKLEFKDNNNDRIADVFQNSMQYYSLGFENFQDSNQDTIADVFQTREAYQVLGLTNFMDFNNDGLCDNYSEL